MWSLQPAGFAQLPGWQDDDHEKALAAFAIQTLKPSEERYRQGRLGPPPEKIAPLAEKARATLREGGNARAFFEMHFRPFRIVSDDGSRGMVTGFYEPVVMASRTRDARHQTPLLARPDDLVAVNDATRPATLDASFRFARRMPDGTLVEYFDRAAIETGALSDRGLEIAWLEDPADAFFIHIQGAARLKFEDGTTIRVTYDGKSGHPFTAIGALLIERGEIARENISMQSIRAWLAAHPGEAPGLMRENRSYIFFRTADVDDDTLGPVAAAKVPLSAGRSLAVDRLEHTFSSPVYVDADRVNGKRFSRLMIAQETGTAIVGASRGDIFFGSGDAAGEEAGAVKSACDFWLLMPADHAETIS